MAISIGVAAFSAHWFQEMGLQDDPTLSDDLKRDYRRMVESLKRHFPVVVAPGVISTEEEAARALSHFRDEAIDAQMLVHIVWSEDQPLLRLLEGRMREWPLFLWNYHPFGALPPLTMRPPARLSPRPESMRGQRN